MSIQWESIRLLVLDVDGVLTPRRLMLAGETDEIKAFSLRDGRAIKEFLSAGRQVAVLSSRDSVVTARRTKELGIETVTQGCLDKAAGLRTIMREAGVREAEVCYVGDDTVDLPAMQVAGVSVAVADAATAVRLRADHVTDAPGGDGAVAEVIERVLHAARVQRRTSEGIVG